jgi:RNA polymerase sigma factor (sigma-70 family)
MTQQPFDELLDWFDPADRNRAAAKYETIRRSLIKIFVWGGCIDAEGMADEAFNRVEAKAQELKATFDGDPALYFYGVAKRLIKECQRSAQSRVSLDEAGDPAAPLPVEDDEEGDPARESECLRRCLGKLSPADRKLILSYYMKDKQAKIDYRKELARQLGIVTNALRVRVYRIRAVLEECIEQCLDEKAPDEMD